MLGIILVGHDAGGKSTIARYIADMYRSSFTVSFADPLKRDLEQLGIPVWSKPYSTEVRNLARIYGETQMALHGDMYWVNLTFDALDKVLDDLLSFELSYPNVIICDDVRHHHEYKAWINRFPNHLVVVLTNNKMTNLDYTYRSVKEVQELIEQAVSGSLPNSIVVENVFSEQGLSEDIKRAIKEKLDALSISSSIRDTQL